MSVVLVKWQVLPNGVLVALAELTDLSACKYFIFCGVEVGLHDEPTVIRSPILVNDVEDLLIDIAACHEEARWCLDLDVLALL